MKSVKQFLRLFYISRVLARNGLDQVIVATPTFAPFRYIVYLNPWNWRRKPISSRGESLRKTLEQLGPIFIKFGQALSTRPDILPPDIALELCKLQDSVPPFSSELALAIVEQSFGQPAELLFARFDSTPLASASMAQVHAATLKNGKEVVVKILRPDIRKIIEQDISLLYRLARFADRYWGLSKRLKPIQIVQEFETTLIDELDLQREAANASQLRRNFAKSPLLYVPEIYWDYTLENILVMERIYGIPVADVATLKANKINTKKLAERGVEIFFTQVFKDCFFHADMHPGNIFVSYQNPDDPQYICIDFGIIGTLNEWDKRYLAENLYAFFNRDYRRVAELHVESGWVSKDTRVAEFESAIRTVCEPIFEKPLCEISFAQVVLKLFQVARRFQMEVQPQLILLQKTLLAIEGLGRQLYPELDLWATAKPFLKKWLQEQIGPKVFFKQLRRELPFYMEQLPQLPRLLHEVMTLTKADKLHTFEQNALSTNRKKPFNGIQGISLGIFLTTCAVISLYYANILTSENSSSFIGIAFITAFGLWIFKRNK